MSVRRLNVLAILTGLSLILFVIEMQIPPPIPIPGVKIGLANVITVMMVCRFRSGEAALVLLARILLAALFAGQAAALLYSLAGGVSCLIGMLLLKRVLPVRRICLCSVCGAVLHNAGQLAVAVAVLGTPSVLAYFPVLAASGAIAGAFTGVCARQFLLRYPFPAHLSG